MAERFRSCEVCGKAIDPERIEAVPDTRLCMEHAKIIEAHGGEFILTGTQVNIGKAGSLKKNYGDVSIHKRRNEKAIQKLIEEFEKNRQ